MFLLNYTIAIVGAGTAANATGTATAGTTTLKQTLFTVCRADPNMCL